MSNTAISFLLTIVAGFSTMIGTFLIFLKFKNVNKLLAGALSFASSVMICISVVDLVPEGINLLKVNYSFLIVVLLSMLFLVFGILMSMMVDYFFPSDDTKMKNGSLYKVGIISMIAIILHNIPEGIATFITASNDIKLGFSLALAISLHNIPEGISISVPIYYSTNSRLKALTYTFISAISEPFGAFITYLFLRPFINDTVLGLLYVFIAGIMFHISFCELFPKSKSYNYKFITYLFFVVGFVFIFLFH